MKIKLLAIESGLMALGLRKVTSHLKTIHSDVQAYFLSSGNHLSIGKAFLLKKANSDQFDASMIRDIAEPLADADILGISSYTNLAELTKRIITEIKSINPDIYLIWGGVHPIMHPEDAILHADAICTGEGEFAFANFLDAYIDGRDYYDTKNFWFKKNGEIIRNDFLPLATSEEMNQLPFPLYGENELIYRPGKGYSPITVKDHIQNSGLAYNTVWSIGCPYHCTYCGNTKFIENDKNYKKLRHPSVDYLVGQVKDAITKHPHISTVVFYDDSFMAIPKRTLREFADKWKQEINLPFCVQGVIPSFVKEEKFEILVEAGMNRVRMGIQSGSDRILEFYQRPNKPGLIHNAATIITKFKDHMIPPAYDIIVDNPIETKEDVEATLNLLYNLPHPFTLNVMSLRILPNSMMERQFEELGVKIDKYLDFAYHAPTVANIMVYILAIFRPPKWLFEYLLKHSKPFTEKQPQFSTILLTVRTLYLAVRGFHHIRSIDFSLFTGGIGWFFWKSRIVKLLRANPKKILAPKKLAEST